MTDGARHPATTGGRDRSGFAPLLWALGMRKNLTSTTKAVLIALARYADTAGVCFPSMQRIAADTLLSERSCQKAIPDLEAAGFLTVNRNTGRGHASVYTLNLTRPIDDVKGEPRAPFTTPERVNNVHLLDAEKVNVVHPLTQERVNLVRVKGEPRAPQLPIELPSTAARRATRKNQRAKALPNPRRSDPPEQWHHLADQIDGKHVIEVETCGDGKAHAVVAGRYLDVVAEMVCKAAGISNPHWQCKAKWAPLLAWLRDGLHPDVITGAIAARATKALPANLFSLAYFDRAVRDFVPRSSSLHWKPG